MNFEDIDFHSPFDKAKKNASSPEEAIFQSIIIQALLDSISNAKKLKNKSYEAKEWLLSSSEDLNQVALLAGSDLQEINKKSRKFFKSKACWRNNLTRKTPIAKEVTDLDTKKTRKFVKID